MLAHPRRLIVTIIVCNELINIANSSLAATVIAQLLPGVRELGQVVLATCVMLPLILFFGEMTPKSLALRLGERWARVVAWPLSAAVVRDHAGAPAVADDRLGGADDRRRRGR